MRLFKKKNKNFVSRQKRIEEYYTKKKKRRFGIVFTSPIAVAKNIPKKYADSMFGRPIREVHISFWKIFAFLVVMAAVLYFVLFSSFFKVKDVILVNNKILIEEDVENFLKDRNIQQKNIFLLNTNQVKEVLTDYYKRISEVRVYRVLPSKIKIKVVETPSTVVWKTGENIYFLDHDGYVKAQADDIEDMPVVTDGVGLAVSVGDRVVTKNFIEFVNTVDESLKKRFGLGVVGYSVTQTTFELKAHINSGFYILFDTMQDSVEQLDKLSKVYQQGEPIVEYVMLNIDGRVVIK